MIRKKIFSVILCASMLSGLTGCKSALYEDEKETLKIVTDNTVQNSDNNETENSLLSALPNGYTLFSRNSGTYVYAKQINGEYMCAITYCKDIINETNVNKITADNAQSVDPENISDLETLSLPGNTSVVMFNENAYTLNEFMSSTSNGSDLCVKTYTGNFNNTAVYVRFDFLPDYIDIESDIETFMSNLYY